jgi:hypothetical protein
MKMTMKISSSEVKQALLRGEKVSVNSWSIRVTASDEVLMTSPDGESRKASFIYLDRAVKDFAKAAGIPDKTPKPYKYPTAPKPSKVMGPDSTGNKPWKDPKFNQSVVPSGKKSDPSLGKDTTTNSPWKDPVINKRPQPAIGKGGLPNTDLGPDSSSRETKWGGRRKAQEEQYNVFFAINGLPSDYENEGVDSENSSLMKGDDLERSVKEMQGKLGLNFKTDIDYDNNTIWGEIYGINHEDLQSIYEEVGIHGEGNLESGYFHDFRAEVDGSGDEVPIFNWDDAFGLKPYSKGASKRRQAKYEVVSGEEVLYEGDVWQEAEDAFNEYVEMAENESGMVSGEPVQLLEDGEVVDEWGEEPDVNDEDTYEGTDEWMGFEASKKSGKIVDSFAKVAVGLSYEELLNQSPTANLLKDIGDPEKWQANRLMEAMEKRSQEDGEDLGGGYSVDGLVESFINGNRKDVARILKEENDGDLEDAVFSQLSSEDQGVLRRLMKIASKKKASDLTERFLEWHEDSDNNRIYPEKFNEIYKIFEENGVSGNNDVEEEFNLLPLEVQSYIINIIEGSGLRASKKKALNFSETFENGYGRKVDAESPEEIYHLIKSFGSDDDYDWSKMTPRQPGQVTSEESELGEGLAPVTASDPAAKKYWQGYFGEYGEKMTKDDSGKKDRKDPKDVWKVNKAKEALRVKRSQQAPSQSTSAPPGGQVAPVQDPSAAPAQDPSKAPSQGQPGQDPKAPAKPSPGAGDEGLKTLGWTPEDIKAMTPDQKQKIIQINLTKPGASVSPAQVPVKPMAAPAQPPKAPAAQPGQAPAAPAKGMPAAPPATQPAPAAKRHSRERADKVKISNAFQRLMAQDLGGVPQAPAKAPVQAPAAPAKAPVQAPAQGQPGQAPAQAPADAMMKDPESPEGKVFSIYQEILDKDVQASSPTEIQAKKAQELMSRVISEVGMTPSDLKKLFGKENLMAMFPV